MKAGFSTNLGDVFGLAVASISMWQGKYLPAIVILLFLILVELGRIRCALTSKPSGNPGATGESK